MELNKFKIEKKRVLQIILFLAGASIIFFTYFGNLEKEDSTFISEKIETIKPKTNILMKKLRQINLKT